MGYKKSAQYYFEQILERYHDSEWADDAQLGLVQLLISRKRYEEANDALQKFFLRYPDSHLHAPAEKLQREIKEILDELKEVNSKPKKDSNIALPGSSSPARTVTPEGRPISPEDGKKRSEDGQKVSSRDD